jgi:teichuronic acid biosynthesis glycosyltransferase TuaG
MAKTVSIIIPYYRKLYWIKKTLKSIFAQTYKNYEIIIIYDDTNKYDLNKIQNIIKKKNIKLIVNKKNIGAGLSRNLAAKNAKGKYLAFIDADDIWHKDKLKIQLEFMKKNKFKISHTSYSIINKKNKIIGNIFVKKKLTYNDLLKSCDIGLSTVVLEKKLFKKYYFSKNITKEDYSLWLRITKTMNIYGLNQNLTRWRKLNKSLSSDIYQKLKDAYLIYRYQEKFNILRSIYMVFSLSFYFFLKNLNSKIAK